MTSEERLVLIQKFERDVAKRTRWYRFLLVLDQMGNVVFWNGSQDETISSHIGRRKPPEKQIGLRKNYVVSSKK